jgi:hypothetical protein
MNRSLLDPAVPDACSMSHLLKLALSLMMTTMVANSVTAAPPNRAPKAQPINWKPSEEIRSRHYRIQSDLDRDDTKLYADHLDLFYEEFSRRFASLERRAPEVPFVLMFAKEQDYLEVLRNRFGVNAKGSGGMFFISPEGAALAFFTESMTRSRVLHVIQHEGFHQFAHSRFIGALPPWLSEGLAEYFGEAIVIDGRVIIGQSSPGPVEKIRKAVEQGGTLDFRRMLTMDANAWNANVKAGDASVQYLQAWSMVQYLSWADNGRYQRAFEAYIRMIHAGTPSDQAFVQAFGTNDLGQFEEAWKEWARKAAPSSLATAAMRLTYLAEGLLALSREGIEVDSLDDLLNKLRDRGFVTEVSVHGRTERIEPDATVLLIPKDELASERPVFDLIPAVRGGGPGDRRREASNGLPPVVTTRGLKPRELTLKWTRRKSGGLDYSILSPKEAPARPKSEERGTKPRP